MCLDSRSCLHGVDYFLCVTLGVRSIDVHARVALSAGPQSCGTCWARKRTCRGGYFAERSCSSCLIENYVCHPPQTRTIERRPDFGASPGAGLVALPSPSVLPPRPAARPTAARPSALSGFEAHVVWGACVTIAAPRGIRAERPARGRGSRGGRVGRAVRPERRIDYYVTYSRIGGGADPVDAVVPSSALEYEFRAAFLRAVDEKKPLPVNLLAFGTYLGIVVLKGTQLRKAVEASENALPVGTIPADLFPAAPLPLSPHVGTSPSSSRARSGAARGAAPARDPARPDAASASDSASSRGGSESEGGSAGSEDD